MENEKKAFVHIENYTGEKPIEIIYREDEPVRYLEPIPAKLPEPLDLHGTIGIVSEFILQRHGKFDVSNSHIEVDRENATIKLVTNESNAHVELDHDSKFCDEFDLVRNTITGNIEFSEQFKKLHVNTDEWWSPVKLAQYLRLNRSLFAKAEEGMAIVSQLKNVKATITGAYEKTKETLGSISKTEFFQQNIDHNLPPKMDLVLSIFKGSPKERYEVEFEADIFDGEIKVRLVSPSVNDDFENKLDEIINGELEKIKTVLPGLLIIEV